MGAVLRRTRNPLYNALTSVKSDRDASKHLPHQLLPQHFENRLITLSRYWTYVKEEKVNCFLKGGKAETVRKPKHVSGSISKVATS